MANNGNAAAVTGELISHLWSLAAEAVDLRERARGMLDKLRSRGFDPDLMVQSEDPRNSATVAVLRVVMKAAAE